MEWMGIVFGMLFVFVLIGAVVFLCFAAGYAADCDSRNKLVSRAGECHGAKPSDVRTVPSDSHNLPGNVAPKSV
jgi:hypothetical protein